ncbi:MAG TPA: hypothetical protein VJS92_00630, partial [Candidatus Polarisedimenticolaceae bacterium]|nr:hypothetical protein [Candidatus Polarisedimenticolaceae bacterium]
MLRELGHRATILSSWNGEPCDVLFALHARRSHLSIARFARLRPGAPLIVVLTGTDLYRDLVRSERARRSLELASALVVLQPLAGRRLSRRLRGKMRVVVQSARRRRRAARAYGRSFDVCVLGQLRPVKDPFRAAVAARGL